MRCMNCGNEFQGPVCPACGAPAQPQGQPGGSVRGMIPQRSIAVCVILSIITLGIYMFYWIYKINEETDRISSIPPIISGGTLILLIIVTCGIYGIYWAYKQGERLDEVRTRMGKPAGNLATLYLILGIFISIVAFALMQSELNEAAAG